MQPYLLGLYLINVEQRPVDELQAREATLNVCSIVSQNVYQTRENLTKKTREVKLKYKLRCRQTLKKTNRSRLRTL